TVSYMSRQRHISRTGFVPLRLQVAEREIRIRLNGQNPDHQAQYITNTSKRYGHERHRPRHDTTILQKTANQSPGLGETAIGLLANIVNTDRKNLDPEKSFPVHQRFEYTGSLQAKPFVRR